jgi:hypothetical protein
VLKKIEGKTVNMESVKGDPSFWDFEEHLTNLISVCLFIFVRYFSVFGTPIRF